MRPRLTRYQMFSGRFRLFPARCRLLIRLVMLRTGLRPSLLARRLADAGALEPASGRPRTRGPEPHAGSPGPPTGRGRPAPAAIRSPEGGGGGHGRGRALSLYNGPAADNFFQHATRFLDRYTTTQEAPYGRV